MALKTAIEEAELKANDDLRVVSHSNNNIEQLHGFIALSCRLHEGMNRTRHSLAVREFWPALRKAYGAATPPPHSIATAAQQRHYRAANTNVWSKSRWVRRRMILVRKQRNDMRRLDDIVNRVMRLRASDADATLAVPRAFHNEGSEQSSSDYDEALV